MAVGELADHRVRDAGKGVVDGVAHVAMVHAAAVRGRDQLDDLAGVQRAIDDRQGRTVRGALLDDRIGEFAQGPAHGADLGEVPLADRGPRLVDRGDPIRALEVDHAAVDEPVQGDRQVPDVVDRDAVLQFVGVEEVEGVAEFDIVGVAPGSNR